MIQFHIDPLFAIPVYSSQSDFELTKDELKFVQEQTFKDNKFNRISDNINVLKSKEMSRIKDIILSHLIIYWQRVFNCKQDYFITNSWLTKNLPGESHQQHNHQNCVFSGVMYLLAEDDAGSLVFHQRPAIKKGFDFDYDFEDYNSYNSSKWNYPSKTGKIIIFPSWVQHSVTENKSSSVRYTLGYNMFVKGNFGNVNYASDLIIT